MTEQANETMTKQPPQEGEHQQPDQLKQQDQQAQSITITPEQEKQIKDMIIQNLSKSFMDFIKICKSIPAMEFQRTQAMIRFDESFFWMTRAIIECPLVPLAPVDTSLKDPIPPAPPANDGTTPPENPPTPEGSNDAA